jgi:phosphohistidine phosphatase
MEYQMAVKGAARPVSRRKEAPMATMELVLMRHGIAVERNEMRTSDAKRPLTREGRRKVRKVAKALEAIWSRPDVVVHSGLVRARETAELVAKELEPKAKELLQTGALEPGAKPTELLEFLEALGAKRVVLVGHAPHVDRFLAHVCSGNGGATTITEMGKAGAACLELDFQARPPARLEWLLPPGLLRKLA